MFSFNSELTKVNDVLFVHVLDTLTDLPHVIDDFSF